MKTLIFILLFMLTSCNKGYSQSPQKQIIDGDVYIYEYTIKKPNQTHNFRIRF